MLTVVWGGTVANFANALGRWTADVDGGRCCTRPDGGKRAIKLLGWRCVMKLQKPVSLRYLLPVRSENLMIFMSENVDVRVISFYCLVSWEIPLSAD